MRTMLGSRVRGGCVLRARVNPHVTFNPYNAFNVKLAKRGLVPLVLRDSQRLARFHRAWPNGYNHHLLRLVQLSEMAGSHISRFIRGKG